MQKYKIIAEYALLRAIKEALVLFMPTICIIFVVRK